MFTSTFKLKKQSGSKSCIINKKHGTVQKLEKLLLQLCDIWLGDERYKSKNAREWKQHSGFILLTLSES